VRRQPACINPKNGQSLTFAPVALRSKIPVLEQSLERLALTGPPAPLPLPWNNTPSPMALPWTPVRNNTPSVASSRLSTPLPGEVSPAAQAVSDVRFVELEARVVELEALYTGLQDQFASEIQAAVRAALEQVSSANDERFKELATKELAAKVDAAANEERFKELAAKVDAAANEERFKELAAKVDAAQAQLVELGDQCVQAPTGGESYLSSITTRLRGRN
jgi:hypothetical protein